MSVSSLMLMAVAMGQLLDPDLGESFEMVPVSSYMVFPVTFQDQLTLCLLSCLLSIMVCPYQG